MVSKINAYTGGRPDILASISTTPKRVLDVGCSNGALGRSIKALYQDAKVFGVEGDAIFAVEAKKYLDEVVQVDLDELRFDKVPGDIDLFIFADVLEHTKSPELVVKSLLGHAASDSQVIISLPNIQHITAILSLFSGVWPQRDRGIFDRTHLRFFTLKSIESLVSSFGGEIEGVSRNYRIMDKPGGRINRLSAICRFLPFKRFFTYQYVVRACVRNFSVDSAEIDN